MREWSEMTDEAMRPRNERSKQLDLGLPRLPKVSGDQQEMRSATKDAICMEPEHIYAVSGDGRLIGYATGDPKSIESYFLASCEVVAVHITRIKPLHIDASRLDRWRSLLAEREWIEAELKRINERMDEFSSGR
jgi:hypothetical protein